MGEYSFKSFSVSFKLFSISSVQYLRVANVLTEKKPVYNFFDEFYLIRFS